MTIKIKTIATRGAIAAIQDLRVESAVLRLLRYYKTTPLEPSVYYWTILEESLETP
jgi:hypothetical protein